MNLLNYAPNGNGILLPYNNTNKDFFKPYKDINEGIVPPSDHPGIRGTGIPFVNTPYGNVAINPSTVSTLDFRRMTYSDCVISNLVQTIITLVTTRIKSYVHKNNDIMEFVNETLNNLRIGKRRFYRALMTAVWAGFAVCEKEFIFRKGKWTYNNMLPLPPESILFMIDNNGFLLEEGVIQYFYNSMPTSYANLLSWGQAGNPNPAARKGDMPYPLRTIFANLVGAVNIPTRKCVIFNFDGNNGGINPYGSSMLRSLYPNWLRKEAMWQILLTGANYKSTPYIVAYVDPTFQMQSATGNTFNNISVAQQLRDALSQRRGQNFAVIDAKKQMHVDIDVLNNTMDFTDTLQLMHEIDKQMVIGLHGSVTKNSENGSYALGMSQATAETRFLDSMTENLSDCLVHQVVKPLIQLNWKGEKDWGYFKITDSTLQDKSTIAKIQESAIKYNIINMKDPKDRKLAREELGYPEEGDLEYEELFVNPMLDQAQGYNSANRNVNHYENNTHVPYNKGDGQRKRL